jgi:hypothetical protein
MKLAGVSYTFGREANTTYHEPSAGRLPAAGTSEATGWQHGDLSNAMLGGINPFSDASNSTLIKGVSGTPAVPIGGADGLVGSYDWRLTMTDVRANMIGIPAPASYNATDYELLRRLIAKGWNPTPAMVPSFRAIPGHKSDWKMLAEGKGGYAMGELVGPQNEYPNATWQRQVEIFEAFKQHTLGVFHFFKTDPVVPPELRAKMMTYGLCRDEYNRSGHWPGQLYVRVALRMVSDLVL